MTLTDFLLARIAEDEAATEPCLDDYVAQGAWGLSRVLAECAAKRRIVELHRDLGESQGYLPSGHYGVHEHACSCCGEFGEYGVPWPCDTIRLVALPYADHPHYQEAWRP